MPRGKQLVIILLLALIVASAGIPGVSAMAPDARVKIEPAYLVVGLGETFVIQVVIEEADDLGAFQLNLFFDPSILQVTEASLGAFLGSTGNATVPIGPEVNNAEGRVSLGGVSFGSTPGPSGTGVLATIACIAQGQGSSDLGLQNVQVLDTMASVQQVTVENGRVMVGSTEAPTPVATVAPMPTATATPVPAVTATPAPAATATPVPAPTATPAPIATATVAPAATATSMPTNTPQAMDTPFPTATALPSPTPIVTSPTTETPTESPPPSPSPMPSISVAPTETKQTEMAPSPATPTEETIQAPATATTAPTSPPATPPPLLSPSATSAPPPSPRPSPSPLSTISAPATTGTSGSAVLGVMLAALAVAIVAVFILSRRPGG